MPINFDLEKLRQEHKCVNYFETGLWDPRDDISCKMALNSGFEKVFSIELFEEWVELGKTIFNTDISQGRLTLILDDSVNMNKYMNNEVFANKTIFFLDAHICNDTLNNRKRCPLFDELEAIKMLDRKDNVILIDDIRIIVQTFPWGENSYGLINFLEKIQEKILEINPKYKFSRLNGINEDDVLFAYVENEG
uniref:Methyltransferase n=1 Tax=viral metagenome TaxID=1070528 RepID=A0A6C0LP66_9ZZZZ